MTLRLFPVLITMLLMLGIGVGLGMLIMTSHSSTINAAVEVPQVSATPGPSPVARPGPEPVGADGRATSSCSVCRRDFRTPIRRHRGTV